MSIFGITASDITNKIVPVSTDQTFEIGDAGEDLTTALMAEIINSQEARVLSVMPKRYRELMEKCDGEKVVKFATDGQTTFTLGLAPVTAGTLKLYVNYPCSMAWRDRNHTYEVAASDFTLTPSTGAVVLAASAALDEGDRVWAEYSHTAASTFYQLKDVVLNYIAAELGRRFSYFRSAEGFERFEAWEQSADRFLKTFQGIGKIEDLELVDETSPTGWTEIFEV